MSSITLMAWAGALASPLDDMAGAFSAGTSIQPGLVERSQDNELLISCLTNTDSRDTNRSIDGGFTIPPNGQIGWDGTTYSNAVAGAYLVQTTAAPADPKWSYPVSNSANAVTATFRTTAENGGGDGELAAKPRFQGEHLSIVGAFKTPNVEPNWYSGKGIAYFDDPVHGDSLYMTHEEQGDLSRVMQIRFEGITPVNSSNRALYPVATQVQAIAEVTEGHMSEINCGTDLSWSTQLRMWGLMPFNNRLIVSGQVYYDAAGHSCVSHFARSLNLHDSADSFEGWHALASDIPEVTHMRRRAAGAMLAVPVYARAALGGPVIATGPGDASIAGSLSDGYSAFSFDPDQFSGTTRQEIANNVLLFYPPLENYSKSLVANHDINGTQSDIWNLSTRIAGAFIPVGYRSIIFVSSHGVGPWCYGKFCNDPAWAAEDDPNTPEIETSVTGGHAYPYRFQASAYDLLHLAEVKDGTRDSWDLEPYATWEITFPYMPANLTTYRYEIGGLGYDPATRRIFIAQWRTDSDKPLINVFTHPAP